MADFLFSDNRAGDLDEHGLPIELKISRRRGKCLEPLALSRVGACGLWQFMLPTGKSFAGEIKNSGGRARGPSEHRGAAVSISKDMYAIYGVNLVLETHNLWAGQRE